MLFTIKVFVIIISNRCELTVNFNMHMELMSIFPRIELNLDKSGDTEVDTLGKRKFRYLVTLTP